MDSKRYHKPSILLVDDSQEFIATAKILLGVYDLSTASNGQDALALLEKRVPDMMFIDLVMPKMSGLELIQIVREKYPGVIMVALTGIDEEETLDTCRSLGVVDYLIKGALGASELHEAVQRIIDHRTTPRRGAGR